MSEVEDGPHDVHDRGYKMLLSFWKVFQQLIEGYVEGDWRDRLDFEKSERLETNFIGKEFDKREADVLYKVPILGDEKEVYLYILIEHQSSVDYMMAFRVLSYLMDIWTEIYKNSDEKVRTRKDFRLPPVFPIVLYNGGDSWTAATSVKDIVEHGDLLFEFIPNVRYHLVDIPRVSREKLRRMKNILSAVFMLEQEMGGKEFKETYQEAMDFANSETDEEIWKAFGEWVVMRLRRKHPEKAEEFSKIDFTKYGHKEIKTMLETMPDKLIAYGKEEGHKEGVKKAILRVLHARFGEISQEIRDKLSGIVRSEILDTLPEKAALVSSLEEFHAILSELSEK